MSDQDLTPDEQRVADDARRGILRGDSDDDAIDQLMHLTAEVTGQDIDELRRQPSTHDEPE